jgi:RNA polymerase sigma-70 factor, ECF subfamily
MTTEAMKAQQDKLAGLFEDHYERIARYIYVRIGNGAEAEDLASEVFVNALESIDKYQDRGIPMQAWLYRIAHNLVVDYLRKTKKYKFVPVEEVEIQDDSDPASTAENHIEIERVKAAMEELTELQREVVQLRFFSEATSQEVGLILNKKDGAVREMQSAALAKLRQLLGDNKRLDKVNDKRL